MTQIAYLCAMRITPKTTDQKIYSFLNYIFDGHLDLQTIKEIISVTGEMRAEGLSGRIYWDTISSTLNLKEDLREI